MDTMLPIGSVVELKDEKDKIVIIGHLHDLVKDHKWGVIQYTGCEYSNGLRKNGKLFYFNEEDIESVYYMGFTSKMDRLYLKMLYDVYIGIKNKNDIEDLFMGILDKYFKDDEEKKKDVLKNVEGYFLDIKGVKNEE